MDRVLDMSSRRLDGWRAFYELENEQARRDRLKAKAEHRLKDRQG